MAKIKLPSPEGTSLDPFDFLNKYSKPIPQTQSAGVADQLEFVTPEKVDAGYGTLGNTSYATQAINERKAEDETVLGLIGKGVARTITKAGVEVLKTPGYIGGLGLALNNEVFGDGANSIQYAVDNQWLNAFERLDDSIKSALPVHISKDVQEGNLWAKMTSGAWWATQGADGLGFMLGMFAPGALTKALQVGKGVAAITEIAANTKLGKGVRFLASSTDEISDVYAASSSLARNADGVTSALMNTVVEAGAEAAGTFDQEYKKLRPAVDRGEMSDQRARELSGQKAASIFKSNTSLLLVSNLLEQAWIFKAFGVKPESVISKAVTDGKIDFDKLKTLTNKEFGEIALEYGKSFAKNTVKEGLFEEGLQTQLEQNISKGKEGVVQATKDLVSGILFGENDFYNNTELHEAIFLGSVLGGGMGLIGQVKENNALKRQLKGYNKDTEQITPTGRVLRKLGLKQQPTEGKGFINLITDNWIKNFKTDYSSLQTNGELDEQKILKSQDQKELILHASYDSAVATGDEISATKFGSFLAYNYVQPFLGQPGMEEIFKDHVENQVVPAWAERFEKYWNRKPTTTQIEEFKQEFIQSGKSAFDSWNKANETNYPERYYRPNVPVEEYAKFRQTYFNTKVQLLLEHSSLKMSEQLLEERIKPFRHQIEETETGFKAAGNNKLDFEQEKLLAEYNYGKKLLENRKQELKTQYDKLFTKKGVEEFHNAFEIVQKAEKEVVEEIQKENEQIKQQIQKEEERITNLQQQIQKEEIKQVVDSETGEVLELNDLQEIDLTKVEAVIPNEIEDLVERPDILEEINSAKEESEVKPQGFVELGKISNTDKITTGRHIQYDGQYRDVLTPEGLPLLGSERQQLWQNEISKINGSHTLRVVTIAEIKKDEDIYRQILSETENIELKDDDVWTILYSNNKPVVKNGNYVFTSIGRPNTIYNKNNLRVSQKFIDSQDGFEEAKSKYIFWYKSQTDNQYSISGITNGHQLVRRNRDHTVLWNPAKTNLPKGKVEIATSDEIESNGSFMSVKQGDVYFRSEKGFVYPLRMRLLNNEEILTIIEIIKKINPKQKLETLRDSSNSYGLFYDKSSQPLIRTLINFGGKGINSIIVDKGNKSITIHPKNSTAITLPISELFNTSSYEYQQLYSFLQDKRLNSNPKSTIKPVLTNGEITFEQINPQENILSNSETTNVIVKGYPERLQRNLVLGTIQKEEVSLPRVRTRGSIKSGEVYKTYTVESLLEEKIYSNEIKKQCK